MRRIEYVYTYEEISDMRSKINEAEDTVNTLISVLEEGSRKDRLYGLLNNIVLVRMKLGE